VIAEGVPRTDFYFLGPVSPQKLVSQVDHPEAMQMSKDVHTAGKYRSLGTTEGPFLVETQDAAPRASHLF
jgi:hypothetical protein